MRTIYVDADYKCHVADDGTGTSVETDFFDGKCDQFVEGYCYNTAAGYPAVYPRVDYARLDEAQRLYEQEKLAEYETLINELYEEVV